MLKIRDEQMNIFAEEMRNRFVRRLVAHLRSEFLPYLERHGVGVEAVESLVGAGLATADGYGITGEADLWFFVECLAVLGPTFHDDPKTPWAHEILCRRHWSGSAKMDAIESHIVFEVRP